MSAPVKPRSGGCHCGAVRFTADLPDSVVALSCNCSNCAMTGFIHVIVEPENFHLEKGEDAQSEYTFNTHTAKHLFCKTCGVKSWYYPRSHPDKVSVNLRCFDSDQGLSGRIADFDGANWEKNVNEINPEMGA
ncbi:GFA family protein [Hyphobacterium sp. CCMP332]|uniref:GFA family protein n=1 Tax=Hyphobacterium sp. CCMP332 TaxID=2749086 RepID=UPI00164F914C|nr:GFA family protein [Hyphobacterium sp. CCMP332]QNL18695.1 GFA family protein [Hyphobacterium sp. CCMP332]